MGGGVKDRGRKKGEAVDGDYHLREMEAQDFESDWGY